MARKDVRSSCETARRHRAASLKCVALAAVVTMGLVLAGTAGCGSREVASSETTGTTGPAIQSTSSMVDQTPTTTMPEPTGTTGTPSPTGSPTTTAPSGPTTTEALSSAETRLPNGHIRAMGFIDKVWESGGIRRISIDYAEMLTGEEARIAAVEAGELPPGEDLPNDYYIRNVNPLKREFTVSSSASITTATFGGVLDQQITWAQFLSFWSSSPPEGGQHMHDMPWWIERDGPEVLSIEEQYLP